MLAAPGCNRVGEAVGRTPPQVTAVYMSTAAHGSHPTWRLAEGCPSSMLTPLFEFMMGWNYKRGKRERIEGARIGTSGQGSRGAGIGRCAMSTYAFSVFKPFYMEIS